MSDTDNLTSRDKIHIALATDDRYVSFALIVINSILHFHPKSGKKLVFHILTDGLSPEYRSLFSQFSSDQVEVKEQIVDTEKFAARWCGKKSPMYYRLELPERIPETDRMIYLDCDVIVLDDIEKLWQMDLQGKPLGAIGDRAGLQEKRKCYCPDSIMFNSGVMLLDLAQWRKENYVPQLAVFWEKNISWMNFADQGLLNAFFGSRYAMLPQQWNIINSVYRNPPAEGMYTSEEIREAIRHPGIVHFTGHHKPWKFWKSFHHPYGYTFCLCAIHTPGLAFLSKLKYWLKLRLRRRFTDSSHQREWSKEDLRSIRW